MLTILDPVRRAMTTTTFQLNIKYMSYYSIHASNKTLLYIQNIPLFLIGSIP